MKLLIASRNACKTAEIRAVFALPSVEIVSASDLPGLPEVVEDSRTLDGNAVKKAMTLAMASGLWALADDSGLEVDALGGAPGVHSARYAGEHCDYADNNRKLLKLMAGESVRDAHFVCVIALSSPCGRVQTVRGSCDGHIVDEARGSKGFGYDPLFVPEGYATTFAEMDPSMKNRISHRGVALQQALERWGDMLAASPHDWPGW